MHTTFYFLQSPIKAGNKIFHLIRLLLFNCLFSRSKIDTVYKFIHAHLLMFTCLRSNAWRLSNQTKKRQRVANLPTERAGARPASDRHTVDVATTESSYWSYVLPKCSPRGLCLRSTSVLPPSFPRSKQVKSLPNGERDLKL